MDQETVQPETMQWTNFSQQGEQEQEKGKRALGMNIANSAPYGFMELGSLQVLCQGERKLTRSLNSIFKTEKTFFKLFCKEIVSIYLMYCFTI